VKSKHLLMVTAILSHAAFELADAALTINNWTSATSSKWETAGNWSAGAPTNSNAANLITNATTKTVTIDATTTNAANVSTLTISNLTLSGPAGTTNTLQLTDAGTSTPLRIRNGLTITSRGALLVTNSALRVDAESGADFLISGGMTVLAGGGVVATNTGASTAITIVNIGPGSSSGSLNINGGSLSLSDFIVYTGAVWMADGTLVVTNTFYIGEGGMGEMTVSNGTVLGSSGIIVGRNTSFGRGTLTIAGGTVEAPSMQLGKVPASAIGTVWMTGGQLVLTNNSASLILLGETGAGEMTVSNGTVLCRTGLVGSQASGRGTLTIAGGTNTLIARLVIGNLANSTGAVWVTGGRLVVEDGGTLSSAIGSSGVGQMTVSNGTWLSMANVSVGSQGSLTIAGGTSSVFSSLSIGGACPATRPVNILGGELNVTNALASATLSVGSGTLTLSSGTLRVDRFVMTSACGFFTRTGGTFIYGTAVLDPARDDDADGIRNDYEQSHGLDPLNGADANVDSDGDGLTNLQEFQAGTDATNNASAFRITVITRQDNTNMLVTWTMGPNKTNALQRTTGVGSSYSNNFADIFIVTNTVNTTTNYLDVGAASAGSTPRFYRIRLVP
jgi:hypothetical protein